MDNAIETGGDGGAPPEAKAWVDEPAYEDVPASAASIARPHQSDTDHPLDTTRSLFTKTRDVLFGHEPEDARDPDQAHVPGVLPALGAGVKALPETARAVYDATDLTQGPALSTYAKALPQLWQADVKNIEGAYHETVGAQETFAAEKHAAALRVLPQVIARMPGDDIWAKTEAAASDPVVKQTAIDLGISPQAFVHGYGQVAQLSPDEQARQASDAQKTLEAGAAHRVQGQALRQDARAQQETYGRPSDANGSYTPMSAKGLAFNVLAGAPQMGLTLGAATAAGLVGGPAAGIAAGAAMGTALALPAQVEGLRNQIDDTAAQKMEAAQAIDARAPVGQKGALNPQSSALRQQAADLSANRDRMVNSAAMLYAVGDAAVNTPVSAVLARTPGASTVLDNLLGKAITQSFGGRVAETMLANGVAGSFQTALQTAIDTGITHRDVPLADAVKDMVHSGVVAAIAATPFGVHAAVRGARADQAARVAEGDRIVGQVNDLGPVDIGARPSATSQIPDANPSAPSPGATPAPAPAAPEPQTAPGGGAGTAKQTYQTKLDALAQAASQASKRSEVTLEPEEQGWSVHVQGQPVAKFDTVQAAREALAQARKAVGTAPPEAPPAAQAANAAPATPAEAPPSEPAPAPQAPSGAVDTPVDTKVDTPVDTSAPPDRRGEGARDTPERRQEVAQRMAVADMSPDDMRDEITRLRTERNFNPLTGMASKTAWGERERKPYTISFDADGLKAANDFGGHQAGDQVLKTIAQAFKEQMPAADSAHISGDEFMGQADSEAEAHAHAKAINDRLSQAVIEVTMPDGRKLNLRGLGVSYGVGKSDHEAEGNLQSNKSARQAAGQRAPRGDLPPGSTIEPSEAGRQDHESAPATESEKPLANPRIVSTDSWHGLPIGIENEPGSTRTYVKPDGTPGSRVMKVPYGEFTGTKGADGDGVDVFKGPDEDHGHAYVIDQLDPTGSAFDEHKVVLGAQDQAAAKKLYLAHYQKGWKGFGGITRVSAPELKNWLRSGDHSRPMDPDSVPGPARSTQGPSATHDSVLQYLARHSRGLDSTEAQAQGIDKADMGSSAAHVGIKRAFRSNGMSFDEAAEHLHEAGYPVADERGHYNPNTLLDRIAEELRGNPSYSDRNPLHQREPERDWREPVPDAQLAAMSKADTAARLKALQAEHERLEAEIERLSMQSEESPEEEGEEGQDRIRFARNEDFSLTSPGGRAGKEEEERTKPPRAVQQDLFGDRERIANEIKRVSQALDEKRTQGQESVETGKPDDLFSQARKQQELPEPKAKETGGVLEDAGQKIGGARKDKWAERGMRLSDLDSISEGEAAELVTKKAVWNPQWEAAIAGGMDPKVASLAKVLIDQLGARPRFNTPQGRRDYVETMGRVREMVESAKSREDLSKIEGRLVSDLGVPTGYSIASTPEQKAARDKFWSIQKGRRSTLRVAGSDLRKADELLAKGWPAKAVKPAVAPTDKGTNDKPAQPVRPHLASIERVGPPVRTRDVTAQDFIKDLSFRGLEFGNYAANDERQALLNHAYEGLHDLARMLGVPPKALSLNGTLGLALGARGSGGAVAHYEPGKLVINMTKLRGAGALAHEWGHALDHYFGEYGREDAYQTIARGATGWRKDPTSRTLAHLRPEMQAAWNGVMQAMFKRHIGAAETIRDNELYLERARASLLEIQEAIKERPEDLILRGNAGRLNAAIRASEANIAEARANPDQLFGTRSTQYAKNAQGLGEYWRRPNEMFARAFEAFIADKLEAHGERSDYLVHGTKAELYDAARYPHNPYPKEDRAQINAALQGLADTLEVRDQGDKPVLYGRQFTPPAGWSDALTGHHPAMTTGQIRAEVDRFLKGFKVQPQVVIAKDLGELKADPVMGPHLKEARDGDVIAFYQPGGKIYIVGDQMRDAHHVTSTVAHEYVTHFGLRAALGDREAEYQAILDGIAKAMPAEMRRRGEREFPEGYQPKNALHRNVAAEETLAYYGQRYAEGQSVPDRMGRWLDKLHALIRDWIRRVLGLPKKFDELFVKRTLADLETYLRRGKSAEEAPVGEPAFGRQSETFVSAVAQAVDTAKRERGTGAEWEATLRNTPGVKAEEMQWLGLKEFLDGRGRVSRQEIADFVHEHQVRVQEVLHEEQAGHAQFPLLNPHIEDLQSQLMNKDLNPLSVEDIEGLRRGGDQAAHILSMLRGEGVDLSNIPFVDPSLTPQPKFGEYVQPGPHTRYREHLYTLPARESAYDDYRNNHWSISNVLAHERSTERIDASGARVYHIEENQSDWHQAGRQQGYQSLETSAEKREIKAKLQALNNEAKRLIAADENRGDAWHQLNADRLNLRRQIAEFDGIPDAPFKKTWPMLVFKAALRRAVEEGYDKVTWSTGAQMADLFDLSRHIAIVHYSGSNLSAYDHQINRVLHLTGVGPQELPFYIGKEAATKLMAQPPEDGHPGGLRTLEGLDLHVGGEGMKGFYDQILPAEIGKYVKKWGARVGTTELMGDKAPMPVHSITITPSMRDSVMAGQPLFRKKGPAAAAPAPAPKRSRAGANYELARRAVQAIPGSEFAMSFRRVVDPSNVSDSAKATAIVSREAFGALAHDSEESLHDLQRYAHLFDQLSPDDRMAFIDAVETGAKQPLAGLQPAADAIRAALDDWRERIRSLGVGALDNFIENYFPHIWKDPDEAKSALASLGRIFGRKPLKGPASFLKERTIPTTLEGLAKGLVPVSTNPLILAFAKLREMQRFHMGVTLMQRFKDEGLARFLSSGKPMPDGWAEINDAVGRVRQWSEQEGGFIERGRYIMPVDGARVINNHLSASALRNVQAIQVLRGASNAINQLQLGFSAFHLFFTSADAVISKNALGVERLMRGEPLKAAQAFLEAGGVVSSVGMNLARGSKLMDAYADLKNATPEMKRIVEGLMAAGGQTRMDNYFGVGQGKSPFRAVGHSITPGLMTGATVGYMAGRGTGAVIGAAIGGFTGLVHEMRQVTKRSSKEITAMEKSMGSIPRQYATRLWRDLEDLWKTSPGLAKLALPLEVAGRAVRASTALILEHIVPLQKMGVFSDLAADHIRRNPDEPPASFALSMQKIWNSVDNRLGELVYNNLFWNRTFKDILHLTVRAVGWNLGSVRELGGAPVDAVKVMDYIARGAPPEDPVPGLNTTSQARIDYEQQKALFSRLVDKAGHKIPYTISLVASTMILGSILNKLFTGEDPKDFKDMIFPRTGRLGPNGAPERISMPTYMKDVYEVADAPFQTAVNKANPIFGMMWALHTNRDFFLAGIMDPDADEWTSIREGADYVRRQSLPFTLQGSREYQAADTDDAKGQLLKVMPYVGFGPAPGRITAPEQQARYEHEDAERAYLKGLKYQLKKAIEAKDQPLADQLREDIRHHQRELKDTTREIRGDKIKANEAAKKIGALVDGKPKEEAVAALSRAGYPAFAALWGSIPDRPRDRVLSSLEKFA